MKIKRNKANITYIKQGLFYILVTKIHLNSWAKICVPIVKEFITSGIHSASILHNILLHLLSDPGIFSREQTQ
jgi:uncharacterized membrane protein YqaE (UPF0057 family)